MKKNICISNSSYKRGNRQIYAYLFICTKTLRCKLESHVTDCLHGLCRSEMKSIERREGLIFTEFCLIVPH